MGLQPRSSSPAKAKRLQLLATLSMALRAVPGGSGGPELLAEGGSGPARLHRPQQNVHVSCCSHALAGQLSCATMQCHAQPPARADGRVTLPPSHRPVWLHPHLLNCLCCHSHRWSASSVPRSPAFALHRWLHSSWKPQSG